jgi:plastocyanin
MAHRRAPELAPPAVKEEDAMLRSRWPGRPGGLHAGFRGHARTTSIASIALSTLLLIAIAPAASGADADATTAPVESLPWDYRTVFVVWDDTATDWRADWNDGSSTVGLEVVLDNEASEGWELDQVAHERYDVIVGPDTTSQEARRLRLIFRRPLGRSDSSAMTIDGAAVTIAGFAFKPASIEVTVGTTVTWTNEDPAPHTVTATDGSFDSGTIASGATFSQVFDAVGTFEYACAIHPTMTGSVIVN